MLGFTDGSVIRQLGPSRRLGGRTLTDIPPEIYAEIFDHLGDVSLGADEPGNVVRTYSDLALTCYLFRTICHSRRLRHIERVFWGALEDPPDLACLNHVKFLDTITMRPSPVTYLIPLVKNLRFKWWTSMRFHDVSGFDSDNDLTDRESQSTGRSRTPASFRDGDIFTYRFLCDLYSRYITGLCVFTQVTAIRLDDCQISYPLLQQLATMPNLHDVTFANIEEWEFFPEEPGPIGTPQTPWTSFMLNGDTNGNDGDENYGGVLVRLVVSPELRSLTVNCREFVEALSETDMGKLTGLEFLCLNIFGRSELPAFIPCSSFKTATVFGCKVFRRHPDVFAASVATNLTRLSVSLKAFKAKALYSLPCLEDLTICINALRSPQFIRGCFQRHASSIHPVNSTVSIVRFQFEPSFLSPYHNLHLHHRYIAEALQAAFPSAVEFFLDDCTRHWHETVYTPIFLWKKAGGEWRPSITGDSIKFRDTLCELVRKRNTPPIYRLIEYDIVDWNGYIKSIFDEDEDDIPDAVKNILELSIRDPSSLYSPFDDLETEESGWVGA